MNEFVVIVAGGSGSRMKSDIPKQFIPVAGSPILMHTIRAFRTYSATISIRLILPESQFSAWNKLCVDYNFQEDYQLIAGGETRFDSVKNGLQSIQEEEGLIAVHDGVRQPDGKNVAVNRSDYRLIQTPQTFRLDWMRTAFQTSYQSDFTDCASVLEKAGYPIHLIEGNFENIKITTPEDLIWAEAFLNH